MNTAQHTPTPWTLDAYKDVIGADGVTVASVYCTVQGGVDMDDLNAAFIVRACNAHDQLVAACDRALRHFETIRGDKEDTALMLDLRRALRKALGAA